MYNDNSPPFTSGQVSSSTQATSDQPQTINFQMPSTYYSNVMPAISKSTLWMGELEPWMDEGVIRQIWASLGYQVTVKVINNRSTGQNAGYCFVDFSSPSEAKIVLNALQGATIPGTRKLFRLNWALGGNQVGEKVEPIPEYSIFVGDLADSVDDASLLALFRSRYTSARAAKVVLDPGTNRPRGYGFVRFGTEADRVRALNEMPGAIFQGRPIRVSLATPRSKGGAPQEPAPQTPEAQLGIGYVDTSITTVFVGNLASDATEEDLRNYFQAFGEIDHIKIPPGKGCGFVQFASRHQAERALAQLNGVQIGSNRVRLSWGRLPPDRHNQQQQQRARLLLAQQMEQEAIYQSLGFNTNPGLNQFGMMGNRGYNLINLDNRSGWINRPDSIPPQFNMGRSPIIPSSPYNPNITTSSMTPNTNAAATTAQNSGYHSDSPYNTGTTQSGGYHSDSPFGQP
ncbi:RNA-binding domain-containing protein [Neoconidiobolus thromboides FSU 785]|nr:RNA-binding domain-containing protein [Neoconidiobolus thromboides FSU 785]